MRTRQLTTSGMRETSPQMLKRGTRWHFSGAFIRTRQRGTSCMRDTSPQMSECGTRWHSSGAFIGIIQSSCTSVDSVHRITIRIA